MHWITGKLSDLVEINPPIKLVKGKEYPFVSMDVINPGKKIVEAKEYRNFSGGGSRFQNNDTLFARITPCLENGKISQVRHLDGEVGFGSTEFLVFRGKQGITDTEFVYYFVTNHSFRLKAIQLMVGTSGRQRVDHKKMSDEVFTIPPLPIQRKIAEILGSLDDKIELNRRMNETLEQMAMALYKHWFVDFGPFQDEEFVESEMGLIPRVYECLSYKEIVDFCLGGDWGKDIPNSDENVGVNVIRGADFTVINSGSQFSLPVRYIKKSSFEKRKVKDMDIIIENSVNASSRTTGQSLLITRELLDFIGENTIPASFCKLFRLKRPNLSPIVYMHLKFLYESGDMEQYQNVSSNGIGNFQATQFLENQKIVLPVGDSCNQVLSSISDLLSQIAKNNKESFYLSITRDYLLPRLLSGEIEVREAEEHVEEVLANG